MLVRHNKPLGSRSIGSARPEIGVSSVAIVAKAGHQKRVFIDSVYISRHLYIIIIFNQLNTHLYLNNFT